MSKSRKIPNRIILTEEQMPRQWYNVAADMPVKHAPFILPGSYKTAVPQDLQRLFSKTLSEQEFNTTDRFIDIPEEVLEYYKMFRPSPLIRAYQLEKALDTPARIYYKYEGNNVSGSHKLNTAIAQVYYNKMEGIRRLTTETGAGQWGTAMAMAASFYNIDLVVYMVKASAQQKPYRKAIIQTYGSRLIESPSDTTSAGRKILENDPNCGGSLGCAISEAVEVAASSDDTRYVLGSVLDHVILHQSIIGLETKLQMEIADEYPDIIIGCAGGGSNLGGLIGPFMKDRFDGVQKPYFIAAEPQACPSMTRGRFAYDYCDTGKITPLAKMYTLGCGYIPPSIHSGGLRYHGMSPIVSQLYHDGHLDEARALKQRDVFAAAVLFAKHEAILPAPESSHAIRIAIDEALKCKESGQAKTILFGLSGHGNFDLASYTNYLEGNIVDCVPSDEDLERGFASLPRIPD